MCSRTWYKMDERYHKATMQPSPSLHAGTPCGSAAAGSGGDGLWRLFLRLFIQRGRDANCEGCLSRDNFLF